MSESKPQNGSTVNIAGLNFGLALEALKAGDRIARTGWNGKGQFVYVIPADHMSGFGFGKYDFGPVFCLKNSQDTVQPGWVPSMGDLLADDWQIVE